jgi:CheY-like chemotaxis protein
VVSGIIFLKIVNCIDFWLRTAYSWLQIVFFRPRTLVFVTSKGIKLGTKHKKRVLVAVRPRAATTLDNALASDFVLTFCHSLAEAQNLLANASFDLILCGANFDESRMFELLNFIKSNSATKAIPFVCIKVFEGILHDGSYESVKKACALLKAAAFIDLACWSGELGKEKMAERLRNALHQLILESSQR